MRPLSAIVELSATTGSLSHDGSPAPSFKDDRDDAGSPNESLTGAVNLKGSKTSTPLPIGPAIDGNQLSGMFSDGMRSSNIGHKATPFQVPARNSAVIQRNPVLTRSLALPVPIPDPYSSPSPSVVTSSPREPLEGANSQNPCNLVTIPPPDEEHPSDVDLPRKPSSVTPTNLRSPENPGFTLIGTTTTPPEASNPSDAVSFRSGNSGGGGGNIPGVWKNRSRKQSPGILHGTSSPYRPQHSTFETGSLFNAGYQSRVQSPVGPAFSIYESATNSLPHPNPPPTYSSYGNGQHSSSRFNSNGSQIRGSIAAPSPWQQAGSLGYRPAPFSIPKISQASHLQEYPIDKKGSSCRKFLTGILFTVYIALCFFIVVFVIGGPELGFFTRGFQNSLIATCTVLHPSPSGYVIYMLMHIWNLIWIVWALAVTCQSSQRKKGGCFRAIPPIMTCTFLCELIFGLLAQGLWLFMWDFGITYGAIWLLILQFASFLLSLAVLSSNIVQYCYLLETIFYPEYCFIKVSCQNGIAGLLALSVVELLLNLNRSMTNGDLYYLLPDVSASLVLTLIAITLVVYLILDVFIFEQATRFVISPYLCVTWITCAVLLSRKPEISERNLIILGGIVFLSAMLAGVKVIISIICHRKYASRLPGIPSPYALQLTPGHLTSENL